MFILLLGGDKNFANQLYELFNEYLDRGYLYKEIKMEIMNTFYNKNHMFRWNLFNNPRMNKENEGNLLKSGTRYYHKELKIVSKPPTVSRDIDKGIIASRVPEYFLEPTASYTVQDFVHYFYCNMPIDLQAWPMKKVTGMIKYKINQYGVDKLLFMIDAMASYCKENGAKFDLGSLDDFAFNAEQQMVEIKSNFGENIPYYTLKRRVLFNGTD
jgi:hypothetical protein